MATKFVQGRSSVQLVQRETQLGHTCILKFGSAGDGVILAPGSVVHLRSRPPGSDLRPDVADQLRADLAEAEAAANRAQQEVAEINAKMAGATKKANAAQAEADQARAAVASHVREVYKAGVDPGWLLQTEALSSGDLQVYADRSAMIEYSNNAQNHLVLVALAAVKKVEEIRGEISELQRKAQDTLDAANSR